MASAGANLSRDTEIAIHASVNHSTTHSGTNSERSSCINAFWQPHEHPHRHHLPKNSFIIVSAGRRTLRSHAMVVAVWFDPVICERMVSVESRE